MLSGIIDIPEFFFDFGDTSLFRIFGGEQGKEGRYVWERRHRNSPKMITFSFAVYQM